MILPQLNTQEMMELEQLAAGKYGVSTDQMMQNAGRTIYDFVIQELPWARRILVVAGKGNNGGDALVAGRLLSGAGRMVDYFKSVEDVLERRNFENHDLIIDGLFGFSLKGDPRDPEAKIIEQINCSSVPVLAVDVPSGLEVFTGKIRQPAVEANYTLALGMPKKGMDLKEAGRVYLGNLGIPAAAYRDQGFIAPDFSGENYLALD